jgi:hypothetical protein
LIKYRPHLDPHISLIGRSLAEAGYTVFATSKRENQAVTLRALYSLGDRMGRPQGNKPRVNAFLVLSGILLITTLLRVLP